MTRDDIMHIVNATAPRYDSWGIEAHFQLFAQRLLQIEREECAQLVEEMTGGEREKATLLAAAAAIRARSV